MASRNYFSHTTPDGESYFSSLDEYGIGYDLAGENLARNNHGDDITASVAIQDLMASLSHRAIILDSRYTELGVGEAMSGRGMHYFAMAFLAPR